MKGKSINRSITLIAPFAYPLLFQDNSISTGGAERQFFLFGRELAKRGWRVSFITARPNYGSISSDHGFSVYHADFSYLGGSKLRMPYCWISLLRAMKKANSNYYVLKVPGHLLAPMSIFCKTYKRKLVFWAQMTFDANPGERRGMNWLASRLQNWGLKRTNIIIAQSEDQRRGFRDNFGINAQVVPSICESLNPSCAVEMTSDGSVKEVDVLWAGNSLPKKRHEVVFELAKLLPNRTFSIAMNKSNEMRFAEAAKRAEKLPNVIFLGAVPPVAMEKWFQKTKVFLNTSIREGFPNTFLQAWINGVPVVSLNIDPDRIIEKHGMGFVAGDRKVQSCFKDPQKLALLLLPYVRKLLSDEDLRNRIGQAGYDYVQENHSPEVVVPALTKILNYC